MCLCMCTLPPPQHTHGAPNKHGLATDIHGHGQKCYYQFVTVILREFLVVLF